MYDPETLFYRIAQSNLVLKEFKGHSLRVMHLATLLGKQINSYDEDLRIAALLHDIGKTGISAEILLKPDKLNELEYTVVQSHCHIGNTIVRKYLHMCRAASFIRDHHERWDGTGYPRALIGEEITYQGRMIAICDAFDAMTLDSRNYRGSTYSYEEGYEELIRCSWKQFDGDLVHRFITMMKKIQLPHNWYQNEQIVGQIHAKDDVLPLK